MNNPPLHDRIAESFQRQRLLSTPGVRLLGFAEGEVGIELPWKGTIRLHGKVI